jgi:hypothetical protein
VTGRFGTAFEPVHDQANPQKRREDTMAKKPSHYELTVNRPVEVDGIRFRPGARYQVKAAMYDAVKRASPDAVASVGPISKA